MSVDWNALAAASPFALGLPLVDLTTVEAQAWIRDLLRTSQSVRSNAV